MSWKDSYLLINKAFISKKEVKFTNISVEVNVATVPGARITTKESVEIEKGASVVLTTRIISENKIRDSKNNYFRRLRGFEESKVSGGDSGNKIFYQGRVYAVANTFSGDLSLKTIVAIGIAHHLKSIKVPVWTDVKEKKVKNMIKLAFKGWPLKMEKISTKLNSFRTAAGAIDSGEAVALSIGRELNSIINSSEAKTGLDSSVFDRMREDFTSEGEVIKMNHIPFKSVFAEGRSFVNGKFKEMLEKIKDDANPDFLAFWQVMLDIFDVEIVFLPFNVNGSTILIKPRYDELAPSGIHINVVSPEEITNSNRFSNSFREATRVMLNVYTETDVSNFPVYMNMCLADYKKNSGGFLYKLGCYGTKDQKTPQQKAEEKENNTRAENKEMAKVSNEVLNKTLVDVSGAVKYGKMTDLSPVNMYNGSIATQMIDNSRNKLAKAEDENVAKKNREKREEKERLEKLEKEKLEKEKLEKESKDKKDADDLKNNKSKNAKDDTVFVNLKGETGIATELTGLEKMKGIVDVCRDVNYFDVTVAGNDLDNAISGTPKAPEDMIEAKKKDDNFRSTISKIKNEAEGFVIASGFDKSAKRVLLQNAHDLIFGERNLSFSSIFIPTILPGLPVIMFENEELDLCYAKVSGVVHNITPYGSTSDVSGIRTIDSDEGVSLSTFHTFYKEVAAKEGSFVEKYKIEYTGSVPTRTRSICDKLKDTPSKTVMANINKMGNSIDKGKDMESALNNEEIGVGFRRYPIPGEYIDAKYMKYTYGDKFTSEKVFDIMMKRYSFMPSF